MFCDNCGTELPKGENKCPKCGEEMTVTLKTAPEQAPKAAADIPADMSEVSAAGAERAVPKGFSSKKNIIIIVLAAVLAIGGGITAIAITSSISANDPANILKLAERYLSEMNYEQAVIEFRRVLDIDPKNADAYLGLADAYMALDNEDKAIEVLADGYERTGDDRILEWLRSYHPRIWLTSKSNVDDSMGIFTFQETELYIAGTEYLNMMIGNLTNDDLKQIAQLINLTYLDLYEIDSSYDFSISDISPAMLRFYDSQINDISPLSNLTKLTHLGLRCNQISDISPLSGLTNLTYLDLRENQISDISPLSNLTNLTELYLDGNPISDSDIELLKSELPDCRIYS